MPKAVCLLSGGLDSATCLGVARRDGFESYALSFDYGQRHICEVEAAARAHGLAYLHLPVAPVAGGPTREQAIAMSAWLADQNGPALAFCRSGTRSIVTWSLGQALSGARTPAELVELGAGAGYDLSGVLGR